jgi:hypothetical protein
MPGFSKRNLSSFDETHLRKRILGTVLDPAAEKNHTIRNRIAAVTIQSNHPLAFAPLFLIEAFVRV